MGKAEDAGNAPKSFKTKGLIAVDSLGSSVSGRKLSVKIRKLRKIENQMAGERLWTWKRFRLFFYAIK